MAARAQKIGNGRALLIVLILLCYAAARILEVLTSTHPTTTLVAFDVCSALAFALVDGTRRYGFRAALFFVALCAVIGNAMENLSIATGFPFGHYTFLGLMGPKLFSVPILLGLAYIGMAYVSWVLAHAMLNPRNHRLSGPRALLIPFVAAFVMVAWDLAQDPVWSTLLHAWVWRDGGMWFGVPLTNYFGWFLTVFLICASFALYCSRRTDVPADPISARPAIAFYLLCAFGNALQLFSHPAPPTVADAAGHLWKTNAILAVSSLVSLLIMGTFAAIAASRIAVSSSLPRNPEPPLSSPLVP